MRSSFFLVAALGVALIPQAGWAQSAQKQPTDAQLSRSFRDSFLKGISRLEVYSPGVIIRGSRSARLEPGPQ